MAGCSGYSRLSRILPLSHTLSSNIIECNPSHFAEEGSLPSGRELSGRHSQ